jgi:hypothetical protein
VGVVAGSWSRIRREAVEIVMPRAFSSGALSIWSYAVNVAPPVLSQDLGDRCSQRRLAMVDVTDGADVAVAVVTFKLCFGHLTLRSIVDWYQRQSSKFLLDFRRHVSPALLRSGSNCIVKVRASLAHRAQVIARSRTCS